MLIKVNRADCLKKYDLFPKCDTANDIYYYPDTYKDYQLTVEAKSVHTHIRQLAKETAKLLSKANISSLIFLGDYDRPWLYQKNSYAPAQKALQYLAAQKVGKRFSGGLQVNIIDLLVFLVHIFWLQRCNAALPDFNFLDERQSVTGYICKYGNLHLSTLDQETDVLIKAILTDSKLAPITTAKCYNKFGASSAIKGRQTIL